MPEFAYLTLTGEANSKEFVLNGKRLEVPANWVFVPSGDAALTRRLKNAGLCWCIAHRRRNRMENVGLWTDGETVRTETERLAAERETPEYKRKLAASRRRRAEAEYLYAKEFELEVFEFLAFAACYQSMAKKLAHLVAVHATPVGSGTVARTERISVERRAEAAVIAWLRHQTTAYDHLIIPRIKGKRREVRRMIAAESRRLLERYRRGEAIDLATCPLAQALEREDD